MRLGKGVGATTTGAIVGMRVGGGAWVGAGRTVGAGGAIRGMRVRVGCGVTVGIATLTAVGVVSGAVTWELAAWAVPMLRERTNNIVSKRQVMT